MCVCVRGMFMWGGGGELIIFLFAVRYWNSIVECRVNSCYQFWCVPSCKRIVCGKGCTFVQRDKICTRRWAEASKRCVCVPIWIAWKVLCPHGTRDRSEVEKCSLTRCQLLQNSGFCFRERLAPLFFSDPCSFYSLHVAMWEHLPLDHKRGYCEVLTRFRVKDGGKKMLWALSALCLHSFCE